MFAVAKWAWRRSSWMRAVISMGNMPCHNNLGGKRAIDATKWWSWWCSGLSISAFNSNCNTGVFPSIEENTLFNSCFICKQTWRSLSLLQLNMWNKLHSFSFKQQRQSSLSQKFICTMRFAVPAKFARLLLIQRLKWDRIVEYAHSRLFQSTSVMEISCFREK